MKVGFVGLGHMGEPMSRNILAAGHDLVVHDLRRDAAAGLLAGGAAWAASPREAAAGRDVAITMLPAPRQVEQVLTGPDGLLSALPPGAVWVDMSTAFPPSLTGCGRLPGRAASMCLTPRSAGWSAARGRARCRSSPAAISRPS